MIARRIVTGFTLIELIVVIVILTIIGLGTARFVGLGADLYVDAVGRDQVVSQTRYALERLTREIREALPNSVRVGINVGKTVQCIEFVPIEASSTYVNIPVSPEAASDTVTIVQPPLASASATRMVVYPLNTTDIYTAETITGNVFSYGAAGAIDDGTDAVDVTLNNTVLFDADSPTSRYYLVANAVSYCVNASTGQLTRYANYWPELNQEIPTNDVVGVLMAENIVYDDINSKIPFTYSGATLVANAVVQLEFYVNRLGEEVTFHHEVHLVNVP